MLTLTNGMTCSEGTHFSGSVRPGDIGTGLCELLDFYAHDRYLALVDEYEGLYDASADANDPWWDTDEADECIGYLFSLADELAPEGWYFGAHMGDGADFGFWATDEEG